MRRLTSLIRDRGGATAIEYGLIAALIAAVAIGAISALGSQVRKPFENVTTNLRVS